jgi:hypothetical protein
VGCFADWIAWQITAITFLERLVRTMLLGRLTFIEALRAPPWACKPTIRRGISDYHGERRHFWKRGTEAYENGLSRQQP